MHEFARASSVRSVVRVTGNYSSETPLHPAAMESLLAAFEQGWADPKKISQQSARAAILRNQSLENIAHRLGLSPDTIEVLGEPYLGHYLGIAGLLDESSTFVYSATDKGKIRAIARNHPGPVLGLEVDHGGQLIWPKNFPTKGVLSLQLANGETGVLHNVTRNTELLEHATHIAIDATTSGPRVALPSRWSTALFDAQSWAGPAGLGILAINTSAYRYPLPHLAPIKSPGSFSLPLLIAAAVALENFVEEAPDIRHRAVAMLGSCDGIDVVAADSSAVSNKLSLVVSGVAGEQLVRALSERGFTVDSGSACSPADLQPSHVLAAMGYPTTGQIRLTLHRGVTETEIGELVDALTSTVAALRG